MSIRTAARYLTAILLIAAPNTALAADKALYPARGHDQIAHRDRVIVVARVSEDPLDTLPRLQAMADFLAERLAGEGIVRGEARVVPNNQQMISLLRGGAIDVVSETVLSALRFEESAGAELLLREWKKGVPSYRGILIAHRDSGIDDVADLRDKVVAFEDPGSTTGFLAPLALLRARGIEAVPVGRGQRPPAGKVGYVFASDEVNVAAWVARGLVDAGAISNLDWDDLTRMPGTMKSALKVFHEGDPIVRSVLLVRGDMAPGVKHALERALISAHTDPASAAVLNEYYKVTQYDEIVGEVAGDLDEARKLYDLIRDIL